LNQVLSTFQTCLARSPRSVNVVARLADALPDTATAIDRGLLAVSVAAGSLYFLTCGGPPHPPGIVLKALSVSPLAAIAVRRLPGPERWLLGGALAVSATGDVLLELNGLFVPGLGAFLAAQVCYAALFARDWPGRERLNVRQRGLIGSVFVCCVALLAWLWPGLGGLAVPVLAYIAALLAMAATAVGASPRYPAVAWGAVLFVVSDSLIGVGRFRGALPLGEYLVWGSYFIAQLCLALGFIRGRLSGPGRARRREPGW
jgi:uncharacterized membrane protein YhhN